MAKVILTDSKESIKKDEMVISMPSFMEEIKASHRKASGKQVTSVHHLREIVTLISEKYDKDFNFYARIPYSNYEGIAYQTDEDISKIMFNILSKHSPDLLTKVIDYSIKNRPVNVKTIYFTGPETYLKIFFDNGIALEEQ
jgi:hypothetical protein